MVIEDCDLISLLAVLFDVMGPPCVCYGSVCCYLQRPVVIEDCDLISLLAVLFDVMGPSCVCYDCLLLPAASSGDDCDLISLLAVLFVVMGPPCVCYDSVCCYLQRPVVIVEDCDLLPASVC